MQSLSRLGQLAVAASREHARTYTKLHVSFHKQQALSVNLSECFPRGYHPQFLMAQSRNLFQGSPQVSRAAHMRTPARKNTHSYSLRHYMLAWSKLRGQMLVFLCYTRPFGFAHAAAIAAP